MIRLRIGTRSSKLAVAQSRIVSDALKDVHEGVEIELVELTTRGDTLRGPLADVGGKGLFTWELEERFSYSLFLHLFSHHLGHVTIFAIMNIILQRLLRR